MQDTDFRTTNADTIESTNLRNVPRSPADALVFNPRRATC